MTNNITIQSAQGDYQVSEMDSLSALTKVIAMNPNKKIAIIDKNLYQHYPDFLAELASTMPILPFDACEQNKNMNGLTSVLHFMQQQRLDKKSELIVLGGGITQDVSALASHLYYRGIQYTLIPTTLLGMADSCIGSKSSLNFGDYKNQLGTFYAPKQVYICVDFLKSLSKLDLYSGYGEILKLFIINNSLADFQFRDISVSNNENKQYLLTSIFKALEIKKRFIEQDEFDQGVRRILNYGHTFGHAIESLSHYKIPHGLAVVLGMDIANYIAMRLNLLSEALFEDIHLKITHFFDWSIFDIDIEELHLLNFIKQDKKAQKDKINMALLTTQQNMVLKALDINVQLSAYLTDYFTIYPLELNIGIME